MTPGYLSTKLKTERLNRRQMEILVKNHGSFEAVKEHLDGISQLADTIYIKAKQTKMEPYWVKGADEKPLIIDPVSITFHRSMNIAKKKMGFIDHCSKPVDNAIDVEQYRKEMKEKQKRRKK